MKSLADILLPYQRQFIFSPKKRKMWLAARQVGKSFCLGYLAVCKALSKKGGLSLIISTGARAASEIMKKVQQFAEAVQVMSAGRLTYAASADCVKFNNGSRVLSLPSGNPAGLRGYTSLATIIDEAAFIERPEDVMAAILPTLTRDQNAELIVASTPAGKHSMFFDLYQKAVDDEDWLVQTTTIYDAKEAGLNVDIEALKSLCPDPDIFSMEYMCQFVDNYGSFIDQSLLVFSDDKHDDNKQAWMGMDIGATNDRTAVADVVLLPDGVYFVRDIVMMHKADYQHQLEVLQTLNDRKKWLGGYIDANGIGNPIAEFANKKVSARIHGFNWTASSKTPAYENVRALLFDRKLVFASHLKSLIEADFQNVSRVVNEAGVIKYVAGRNENGHSDSVSALVLALAAAKDNPVNLVEPQSYMRFSPLGQWRSRMV